MKMLQGILDSYMKPETPSPGRQFIPSADLKEKDSIIVDMLNSEGGYVSYCISDPNKADTPIVFASDGFCALTGYGYEEIEGRNCRFLQGPETSKTDVDHIRHALKECQEASVNLLNYRKDGTTFANEFFICPLRDRQDKLLYFIGVQCSVPKLGPGQMPANPGWVYTQGNHS